MLPIFILIIASIISVSLFFITSFQMQCDTQNRVIASVNEDSHIVKKIELSNNESSRTKGLYKGVFEKNYKAYRYVLDEEAMVRAGSLVL